MFTRNRSVRGLDTIRRFIADVEPRPHVGRHVNPVAISKQQFDRRRDLVLAAFALGSPVDILEDLGRERLTSSPR